MKLLILGAGGHGRVVRETAEAMGCFETIAFLDDHSSDAIGKLADYPKYQSFYDSAFVAIGDNRNRSEWIEKLKAAGFSIPVLIHPRAYISPSATIGVGTIVEPIACVNSGVTIGAGCIISISTSIDHDSIIENYCHIDCGVVIKPMTKVASFSKILD